MQYVLPQFTIGDVVRAEMTIEHRTEFVYGSIRQCTRPEYMVVCHEQEKQERHQTRSGKMMIHTASRSPNQLWPERWDLLSKGCLVPLFYSSAPRCVCCVNKLIFGVRFVMEVSASFE